MQTTREERSMYAYQLAAGLAYVHLHGVVHRYAPLLHCSLRAMSCSDIACRNVLLDAGKHCAKLSDFGLSRKTDAYRLGPEDRVPIRWCAFPRARLR